MAVNWVLPVRVVQFIFAIIELGLTGYVASKSNAYYTNASPSQVNFLIFCSVWTLLVVVFLILAPRYDADGRHVGHKFSILAVDVVTAIFWFAGFIALAALIGAPNCGSNRVCGSAEAACAFGAFLWILFSATSALDIIHVFKRSHDSKPAREVNVSEGV